jgi:hypothetical protein
VYALKDGSSEAQRVSQALIARYSLPRLLKAYPAYSADDVVTLLEETWDRGFEFEPYTQFKERAHTGRWVNVDANGFRRSKNNGPWPPDLHNRNIFLFGGSCAFGYGVADDQTVASHLQDFLAGRSPDEVKVYNFAAGYYFSSQERIRFCELLVKGFVPDAAIFVDGPNDFFYCEDEPKNTPTLRAVMEGESPQEAGTSRRFRLPIQKLVDSVRKRLGWTAPDRGIREDTVEDPESYNDPTMLSKQVARYLENKRLIESAARLHGVATAFVWQPVPNYKYQLEHHLFRPKSFGQHTCAQYGYGLMSRMLKGEPDQFGEDFLWLADIQADSTEPHYVDYDHFTGRFSQEVAGHIGRFLIDRGILARERIRPPRARSRLGPRILSSALVE